MGPNPHPLADFDGRLYLARSEDADRDLVVDIAKRPDAATLDPDSPKMANMAARADLGVLRDPDVIHSPNDRVGREGQAGQGKLQQAEERMTTLQTPS